MRLCAARERSCVQRSIPGDARMMSRTLSRWPCWRELLALLARRCSAHALDVPDPALQRLPRTPHGTTARSGALSTGIPPGPAGRCAPSTVSSNDPRPCRGSDGVAHPPHTRDPAYPRCSGHRWPAPPADRTPAPQALCGGLLLESIYCRPNVHQIDNLVPTVFSAVDASKSPLKNHRCVVSCSARFSTPTRLVGCPDEPEP